MLTTWTGVYLPARYRDVRAMSIVYRQNKILHYPDFRCGDQALFPFPIELKWLTDAAEALAVTFYDDNGTQLEEVYYKTIGISEEHDGILPVLHQEWFLNGRGDQNISVTYQNGTMDIKRYPIH